MLIGGSISFQLVEIFNIIEDSSLSTEEKIKKVSDYQKSLTDEQEGELVDKNRGYGQNTKNGFYVFGNVDEMSYESLVNVKKYVDNVLTSLTCEGEMKMRSIIKGYDEKEGVIYDFSLSDKTYSYAMAHGKNMRGHTLVWHKHEPKEVLDKYIEAKLGCSLEEYQKEHPEDFLEERKKITKGFLGEYMELMGKKYPNCYCWDVLNEIVPELETDRPSEEERSDGLRHSLWKEYLGDEFYIDVLEIARDKLPKGTKLFYNDFGEQHPEKRQAILKVIENIKRYEEKTSRVILDGIGLQSHYDLNVTPEQIEQIHQDFAKTGKEVQVTEIDIMPGRDRDGNVREFDPQIFENLWKKVFECVKKYGIEALTGWGIGDDLNWYSYLGAIPTMLDKHGNIKEFAREFLEQSREETELTDEKNSFMSKLRSGVKTTEEMAAELGTEEDKKVKSKVIGNQTRSEI